MSKLTAILGASLCAAAVLGTGAAAHASPTHEDASKSAATSAFAADTVSRGAVTVAGSELRPGQSIKYRESLCSPDKSTRLICDNTVRLEVDGKTKWIVESFGGNRLEMGNDGNLRLKVVSGLKPDKVLWQSQTADALTTERAAKGPNAYLFLRVETGKVCIVGSGTGTVYWERPN